jgi:chemotaxis protein MotB
MIELRLNPLLMWRPLLWACLFPVILGCVSLDYYEALREAYEKAQSRSLAARSELTQLQKELAEMNFGVGAKPVTDEDLSTQEKVDLLTRRLEAIQAQLRTKEEEKASLDRKLEAAKTSLTAKDQQMKTALHDLEASLKEEISKGSGSVRGDEHAVNVVLAEQILYDSGSAEIRPQGLKVLERISDALRSSPATFIRVEGHTDDVRIRSEPPPRFLTNFELSYARAIGVVKYLKELDGVEPWRLSATGLAGTRPLMPNTTDDARAHNRRVQIVVTPSR